MKHDFINLTTNNIKVLDDEGATIIDIPSSGIVSCKKESELVGEYSGIRIFRTKYGNVVNMPEPKPNTFYIVSKVVAESLKKQGRNEDIVIPDNILRNAKGVIIGCKTFSII